jgi:tRNA-specific 2-thiouridylase
MEKSADFVATGHYARVGVQAQFPLTRGLGGKGDEERQSSDFLMKNGLGGENYENGCKITRGQDPNKDQSYFLWQIKREQIPRILFPVGEFATKAEVRQKAEEFNLITAEKPDSQGLCFIGDTPLRELLLQTLGQKEGEIVREGSGEVLGQHPGAFLYTIGQREKLGLSGGPWFVSRIDVEQNLVYVTHQEEPELLYKSQIQVQDCNWQVEVPGEFQCQAQVRYRQKPQDCNVQTFPDGSVEVVFDEPVRAAASGQSMVFYENEVLLGGGVIV